MTREKSLPRLVVLPRSLRLSMQMSSTVKPASRVGKLFLLWVFRAENSSEVICFKKLKQKKKISSPC